MAAILNNLSANDILFIAEIPRLNRQVEEVLYPAMEDYSIDIMIGKGQAVSYTHLDVYKRQGVYLPLITTNCAVLGVAISNIDSGYNFAESMANSFGISVGFLIAIVRCV